MFFELESKTPHDRTERQLRSGMLAPHQRHALASFFGGKRVHGITTWSLVARCLFKRLELRLGQLRILQIPLNGRHP